MLGVAAVDAVACALALGVLGSLNGGYPFGVAVAQGRNLLLIQADAADRTLLFLQAALQAGGLAGDLPFHGAVAESGHGFGVQGLAADRAALYALAVRRAGGRL